MNQFNILIIFNVMTKQLSEPITDSAQTYKTKLEKVYSIT
jgi:hypothetical protein